MYLANITLDNIRLFLKGHRKTAVFALSPECNCRCTMCGMWRKPVERISFQDAKKVIEFLVKNRFIMVYFTGGEPTLYPQLPELVKYAHDLGLITILTTNGTAKEGLLEKLKRSGLQSISISLDHYRPEVCEAIRGVKGIWEEQLKSIRYAKGLGLKPYALAYLNRELLRNSLIDFIRFVNGVLGVPWGFCFPTKASNSYNLRYEYQTEQELKRAVKSILYLKLYRRASIANTITYLYDALRFLDGVDTKYKCRGGTDVVYIDWRADVYPCFLKAKLFNCLTDRPRYESKECDECLTNCFREPSYIAHMSLPIAMAEFTH
ncbi:MAG: radical SAM protein [Nitrososphaerota archaeon]